MVPFAPGGSSEIVARATAAELTKAFGTTVFVDNKPGQVYGKHQQHMFIDQCKVIQLDSKR